MAKRREGPFQADGAIPPVSSRLTGVRVMLFEIYSRDQKQGSKCLANLRGPDAAGPRGCPWRGGGVQRRVHHGHFMGTSSLNRCAS